VPTLSDSAAPARKRRRLAAWQRQLIIERYEGARTRAQKEELALLVTLSLPQLHGAAYRLGVSRPARGPRAASHKSRRSTPVAASGDFGADDERYLRSEFERLPIEQIAAYLGRSEPEVAFYARALGLRRPSRLYEAEKTARWLGLTMDGLVALRGQGVEVHELRGRLGRRIALVEAAPLARWITSEKGQARLAANTHDPFFTREVVESVQAVARGETSFSQLWVSHGHTCLNPVAATFGRFCLAPPGHEPGDDPKCSARLLSVADVKAMSSSWRRD
jgi:hypothetical protein